MADIGKEFDIKKVFAWTAPKEDGAPIIAMPNVPAPLHRVAPRTVLGDSTWTHMRKYCYYNADYKSQISGIDLDGSTNDLKCNAHELYSYDYIHGKAYFERAVCISPIEHNFIHSGRMLTMYKKGNPLMPKSYLLKIVENGFKIIYDWNKAHPKERPLRVYATLADFARVPSLEKEMRELIDKYEIKFYQEDEDYSAKWGEWSLLIGKKEYKTPYATRADWEKAMELNDKTNHNLALNSNMSGGVFDEVDKIIGEIEEEDD